MGLWRFGGRNMSQQEDHREGNGGRGGFMVLEADQNLAQTLLTRHVSLFKADNGKRGCN